MFLVTENWLASYECFGEFQASFYMGKRMIPLFLLAQKGSRSELTMVLSISGFPMFAKARDNAKPIPKTITQSNRHLFTSTA